MSRVLLLGDERKGRAASMVEEVAADLAGLGHEARVLADRERALDREEADLVAVFGGDGSILAAARRMGQNQMPTLGINLGRLGFLTAFADTDALDGIHAALRGELVEEPRLMLHCLVERQDGTTAESLCLNDGVLLRASNAGLVRIRASRPEGELATYSGDGLIVATPVGSTASSSLRAGGPVLSPRLDALVLSPLAPHTLTLRPLVLPTGDGVHLEVLEDGGGEPCTLSIDGQVHFDVHTGDRVTMCPAEVRFRHLTRGPGSFYQILRDKFGWADNPRRPA